MTEEAPLVEQQPEPEKQQTPHEWLADYEKMIVEATGSALFDPDDSTLKDAMLILIAMLFNDSVKDDVIRKATGLSLNKIHFVKSNMRKYGLLHSHQGCRNPTVEFQKWDEPGLEGMFAFLMDGMVAAGQLARIKVDENGRQV